MIRQSVGLLLIVASLPASADVRASVNATQIAPGDTVQLTLAHDGQSGTLPDLAPLKNDFDVVSRSTSSNIEVVNGSTSSSSQVQLTLAPKHSGQLTIPAIAWGSDHSAPLSLDVTTDATDPLPSQIPPRNQDSGEVVGTKRVFLQTEVGPHSPYVQGEVDITARVFCAVPMANADLEFGDSDKATVRQVGSDSQSSQVVRGIRYQVFTRHYQLFPQQSGSLRLAGPTLSGEVPVIGQPSPLPDPFGDLFANSGFRDLFTDSQPIRLHADPIQLSVRARPAGAGQDYWLPAKNLTLQASWRTQGGSVQAGDPVTLDLDLKALGLTAAQLPDLTTQLDLPANIKMYPDPPQLKDTAVGDDLEGERHQSVALIADQPGSMRIPDLHLRWWNTKTDRSAELVVAGRTFQIAAVDGSKAERSPAPPPSTSAATSPEPLAQPPASPLASWSADIGQHKTSILALATAFLLALIAWAAGRWRQRRRRQPRPAAPATYGPGDLPNAATARSAFHAACAANDATAARRHLLVWAAAVMRGESIRGLNALAERLPDENLRSRLRELDRACYAGVPWRGDALSQAMRELPLHQSSRRGADRALAPLYP